MSAKDRVDGLPGVTHVSPVLPATSAQRQEIPSRADASSIADTADVRTAARLTNETMSIPDVRMEKVAAVQRALQKGDYQVSAADVADKLIDHMTKSR